MESISLQGYAKLNLALEVKGKRKDGYHEMEMVMQSVSLSDTVKLKKMENGIFLSCNRMDVSCGSDNIAYRAAEKFFDFTKVLGGIKINLEKKIPFQAGMAGGSADAAAVLLGLNELYETKLSLPELCSLGLLLGADVPFCLVGGTAHVTGIGEKIASISSLPSCCFVIVKPQTGISTVTAFQKVDRCRTLQKVDVGGVLKGISAADLWGVASAMCNTFEQVTDLQEVFEAKRCMKEAGAIGALMSGSGSAVFGLFPDRASAEMALGFFSGDSWESFLAEPVTCGVKIC